MPRYRTHSRLPFTALLFCHSPSYLSAAFCRSVLSLTNLSISSTSSGDHVVCFLLELITHSRRHPLTFVDVLRPLTFKCKVINPGIVILNHFSPSLPLLTHCSWPLDDNLAWFFRNTIATFERGILSSHFHCLQTANSFATNISTLPVVCFCVCLPNNITL